MDLLGDARYGYDAGRHAQVLVQCEAALLRPREWLLVVSLLATASIHARVMICDVMAGILPPVERTGGGMVQGLKLSGLLYSTLPRHLGVRLSAALPGAVVAPDPLLLSL